MHVLPGGLGGIRTGGALVGSIGWHPGSCPDHGIPHLSSRSSTTQTSWSKGSRGLVALLLPRLTAWGNYLLNSEPLSHLHLITVFKDLYFHFCFAKSCIYLVLSIVLTAVFFVYDLASRVHPFVFHLDLFDTLDCLAGLNPRMSFEPVLILAQ